MIRKIVKSIYCWFFFHINNNQSPCLILELAKIAIPK